MALLTNEQILQLRAEYMRKLASPTITKADLKAAFEGLDSFFDTNAAAINSAIPQPARGALTTQQKAAIAAYIMMARYGGVL